MSKTVYLIDQGSYSDYSVIGLHATEEGAKAWVEMLNKPGGRYHLAYDDARYSEIDIETTMPRRVRIFSRWSTLTRKGSEVEEQTNTYDSVHVQFGRPVPVKAETETITGPRGGFHGFRVVVTGEDEKRVEKAYQDRVAQAKAELLGLT